MLLDPNGRALTRMPSKRQVTITDPRVARIAAHSDDVFRLLHLTVVCLHCGETPTMGNHPSDAAWKMECGCTKRTLVNPDQRSH